jgi:hypothetical protein
MKPVFLSAATLLLASVNAGWVDPDSPLQAQTTFSLVEHDKRLYQLVFSDEFEQDGRSFHDGNDPRWTAMNKNDCAEHVVVHLCLFVVLFAHFFVSVYCSPFLRHKQPSSLLQRRLYSNKQWSVEYYHFYRPKEFYSVQREI